MQIEPLPSNLNFANGVDYMNQVISYDRLIFFGHLQESQGLLSAEELDPALKGQKLYGKPNVCFGERVEKHISPTRGNIYAANSPSKILRDGRKEMYAI